MMVVLIISPCQNWGANVEFEEQQLNFSNTISLMVINYCLLAFITISFLLLISDICSSILTFGQTRQKWPILTTKKVNLRPKKKVFFWNHIDMCFLQKTGFKLVKFGQCGSIYILHPAIGGSHPVPCLSTQIAERQGTAMYYPLPIIVAFPLLPIP